MFKVETQCGCDWDDVWTVDGVPQRFPTREAAQAELDEHLRDMALAVADGHMIDAMDADEFRIVPADE